MVDFFYRIEFQHRGSPHLHALVWMEGAACHDPTDPKSIERVVSYVDQHVFCDGELAEKLVGIEGLNVQQHHHTLVVARKDVASVASTTLCFRLHGPWLCCRWQKTQTYSHPTSPPALTKLSLVNRMKFPP